MADPFARPPTTQPLRSLSSRACQDASAGGYILSRSAVRAWREDHEALRVFATLSLSRARHKTSTARSRVRFCFFGAGAGTPADRPRLGRTYLVLRGHCSRIPPPLADGTRRGCQTLILSTNPLRAGDRGPRGRCPCLVLGPRPPDALVDLVCPPLELLLRVHAKAAVKSAAIVPRRDESKLVPQVVHNLRVREGGQNKRPLAREAAPRPPRRAPATFARPPVPQRKRVCAAPLNPEVAAVVKGAASGAVGTPVDDAERPRGRFPRPRRFPRRIRSGGGGGRGRLDGSVAAGCIDGGGEEVRGGERA